MLPDEAGAVVQVWYTSTRVAYPYLPLEQARSLDDYERFFRDKILPDCDVWVAVERGAVQGMMAIRGSYLDRLYVRPEQQRRGIGSALIERAKTLSPQGLELHTHQQNAQARTFYERHGFRAVRFGVSPPPESAPDIEYHWRPV
jgi:ribosomal protein S18 acetylase RimI-like enzyme